MNRVMDCIQCSHHHALVLTVCQPEVWPTYVHFFISDKLGYQNTFLSSAFGV